MNHISTIEENLGNLRRSSLILMNSGSILTMTKDQIRWTVSKFTEHGKFRHHLKKI